ncbi:hypothetical protein K461DRAFT_294838 [Myriangium duriaei CBS 260.36]|uniref:Zn(2)-C6 fungal-type domain-containing protein n=1 Tax=Myriangium duriaei CBS 260.36 TaxID=1168546 RepID=A0A9P4MGC4_9PEZI|nr:hypothetical protein K461DRAFT_294838 [Myriangium duriaei CBS 260.36]
MSVRRTHAKTRTGCDNCKKRHIKCDELGPPCANCQVRGLECTRAGGVAAAARNDNNNNNANSSSNTPATPSPRQSNATEATASTPFGSRLLELELLHRWSTDTYKTFSLSPGDEEVWQRGVPQDALKHEFLLYAIFGITSLHVASSTMVTRARTYHVAALEYQNLAITTFQSASPSLTPANHQAIFTFSILNLALAIALPYHAPRDENRTTIVENLVTMFKMLQGAASIYESSRMWMSIGPFKDLLGPPSRSFNSDVLDPEVREAFARLRAANNEGYVALCAQHLESSSFQAVVFHETNAKAITSLERAYCFFGDVGPLVSMRWLAGLDYSFVEAISRLEPVAVLITMHWAILLDKYSGEKWWAKASGKLLVTELSIGLMQSRPEWRPAAAWVHQQVGLPALE